MRQIIRADGTVEVLDQPKSVNDIKKLLGAENIDSTNKTVAGVKCILFVDELAVQKSLQFNLEATKLLCSSIKLRGDMIIVPASDFSPLGALHD